MFATSAVRTVPGTRLAALIGESSDAQCYHHQAIDRVGDGLSAVAWSDDGIVEAIEGENGWLVAVQWHPEETAEKDPRQQALFDAFVARASGR